MLHIHNWQTSIVGPLFWDVFVNQVFGPLSCSLMYCNYASNFLALSLLLFCLFSCALDYLPGMLGVADLLMLCHLNVSCKIVVHILQGQPEFI